jgi:hypothetical protein
MTGEELRQIRQAFGLSASAMGKALGYSGPRANIGVQVRRLERDARPIPTPTPAFDLNRDVANRP